MKNCLVNLRRAVELPDLGLPHRIYLFKYEPAKQQIRQPLLGDGVVDSFQIAERILQAVENMPQTHLVEKRTLVVSE